MPKKPKTIADFKAQWAREAAVVASAEYDRLATEYESLDAYADKLHAETEKFRRSRKAGDKALATARANRHAAVAARNEAIRAFIVAANARGESRPVILEGLVEGWGVDSAHDQIDGDMERLALSRETLRKRVSATLK